MVPERRCLVFGSLAPKQAQLLLRPWLQRAAIFQVDHVSTVLLMIPVDKKVSSLVRIHPQSEERGGSLVLPGVLLLVTSDWSP